MNVVYFAQGEETKRIKIGCTQREGLKQRLSALRTGCSERLKLVGYLLCSDAVSEKWLHKFFAAERLHGEWFRQSYRLFKFVANVQSRNKFNIYY